MSKDCRVPPTDAIVLTLEIDDPNSLGCPDELDLLLHPIPIAVSSMDADQIFEDEVRGDCMNL